MVADVAASVAVARPRIRIQGAVKSFSGRVVVDVESLVLGDRPIEGLIGPNGAGKTTLMRMVMHSTSLDRGTISFLPGDGSEVALSTLPAHRLAGLGVVKSNQVIMDFAELTVWDSLLLAVAESRYEQPHRIFSERTVFEQVLFMAEGSVILRGAPATIRENRTVVEKYLGEGHV